MHFSIPNGTKIVSIFSWKLWNISFEDKQKITSVDIPNSVLEIDDFAFQSFKKLYSIVIPDSVLVIGRAAFEECISLKSIKLSCNIKIIRAYTFYCCINLKSIILPNLINLIENDAFGCCKNLIKIQIPNTLEDIEHFAFNYCSNKLVINFNWVPDINYVHKFDVLNKYKRIAILEQNINTDYQTDTCIVKKEWPSNNQIVINKSFNYDNQNFNKYNCKTTLLDITNIKSKIVLSTLDGRQYPIIIVGIHLKNFQMD